MLAEQDSGTDQNPFLSNYGALLVRPGDSTGLELKLFFPHAKNKALTIRVKPDVTAEEVIGCAMLKYWESGMEPPLVSDAEKAAWDGEELSGRLNPAAWNLHIVEDEDSGDIDDDFPALDRTKAISAFSFNAFAIVQASAADMEVNKVVQAQITRRPSRVIGKLPNASKPAPPPPLPHQQSSSRYLDIEKSQADDAVSSSLMADRAPIMGPSSYAAPGGSEVLLRIRIPVPGLESVVSTVKVTTKTYLADVVETICKKRKEHLGSSKNWVLMLGDRDILAPTDRTVESLQDNYNLRLVRRSDISERIKAQASSSKALANTNPSASIFKRLSEPPQPRYVSANDVTTEPNKRWRLYRKHAMSLTKHERILSIDGEYLQFLHPNGQPGRTPPYHISQVMGAKPSKRVESGFKLFFYLDREVKRYDLEAHDPKDIAEIITAIDQAKARWKTLEGR